MGRQELAGKIGLGQGTVRTMLEKMKDDGSIDCTRAGVHLTDQGNRRLESLRFQIKPIDGGDLTLGECDCALVIRGMASQVKDGGEQRDEAVKAGAVGATTFVKKDGKILLLADDGIPIQKLAGALEASFNIKNDDVIIIGSGNSYDAAERGAVTAALKLHAPAITCWKEDGFISEYMDPKDVRHLALAIHELVGHMPLSIRTRNNLGVLCEDGVVIDDRFTGPNVEEALKTGKTVKRISKAGRYKGVPVICVPILKDGKATVVIGLVDMTKLSIHDILGRLRKDD